MTPGLLLEHRRCVIVSAWAQFVRTGDPSYLRVRATKLAAVDPLTLWRGKIVGPRYLDGSGGRFIFNPEGYVRSRA